MASRAILIEALKIRLLLDNPQRLRFVQWVGDEWTKFKLGFYYSDHDVMDNAIFTMLTDILAAEDRTLPVSAANTLRNSINLTNSPLEAVKEIVIAEAKGIKN
jgi:hypothetical protein